MRSGMADEERCQSLFLRVILINHVCECGERVRRRTEILTRELLSSGPRLVTWRHQDSAGALRVHLHASQEVADASLHVKMSTMITFAANNEFFRKRKRALNTVSAPHETDS